jgi:NAD(P)-dependent dehydrogenase (short-subunit alcohol dehydrogenase family)
MATKYEAAHQSPKGPGDARPTALQIIKDEQIEGKWSDKTILITGCSSGIGIETAKALHETGATVYATARDLNKAKTALGSLVSSPRFHLLELDLNSMASVRQCAETFLRQSDRLNILINNAGVMATPEGRTADGFETQLGTNHLAHFLLVQLLLPALEKSSNQGFQSRVIILSSVAHRNGEVNFSNLNFDGEYDAWKAYAQSKTANLWTSNEIERRFGTRGVHSLSVHPGGIMTGLMQHLSEETRKSIAADPDLPKMLKSPEQGAATTVWAATAKVFEGQGGKYLEDCQIAKPPKAGAGQYDPGYSKWAYDEKKATLLWEKSMDLIRPWL